jgi:hypothetical protein
MEEAPSFSGAKFQKAGEMSKKWREFNVLEGLKEYRV